MNDKYC